MRWERELLAGQLGKTAARCCVLCVSQYPALECFRACAEAGHYLHGVRKGGRTEGFREQEKRGLSRRLGWTLSLGQGISGQGVVAGDLEATKVPQSWYC